MLTTCYSRPQFIEKIVTDRTGREFKLTFAVSIVNGSVRARLISAEPVALKLEAADLKLERNAFCLPCASSNLQLPISNYQSPALLVSPFTELFFFTSQPTRAPSDR